MASLNDSASIFVGPTLESFNAMETLVARDGDVTYAQKVMLEAMLQIINNRGLSLAKNPGEAVTRRSS